MARLNYYAELLRSITVPRKRLEKNLYRNCPQDSEGLANNTNALILSANRAGDAP